MSSCQQNATSSTGCQSGNILTFNCVYASLQQPPQPSIQRLDEHVPASLRITFVVVACVLLRVVTSSFHFHPRRQSVTVHAPLQWLDRQLEKRRYRHRSTTTKSPPGHSLLEHITSTSTLVSVFTIRIGEHNFNVIIIMIIIMKKRSQRRKHCALAVVRRSQTFSPRRRPDSRGRRTAKI